MDLKDPKSLRKLASACRKSGITSFKGFGVEFTLAPQEQLKVVKTPLKQTAEEQFPPVPPPIDKEIPTDEPSINDMLFWSSGDEEASI